MVKIILSGCNGYMGRAVTVLADGDDEIEIVAGIDLDTACNADYPVYSDPSELGRGFEVGTIDADVVIDFSAPSAVKGLLEFFVPRKIPLILCATGYSPVQLADIENAAEKSAIFRSGNMSVGINLLIDLIKRASSVLGEDFDIEIVERHHKRKVDAPSGTAIMLADAANEALPYDARYVYERESSRKARGANDIGISSVRGGTIVGVHEVIFAGSDEVIELRHSASSRDVFAVGAIRAAKFMAGKPAGLYSMKDVLNRGCFSE